MKRLIPLILVSVFLWGNAMAQDNKITVLDFRMNETDNTSNLLGSTVYDQNGDKCALIKIRTNQEGFSFDVGALGITKVIQKVGEIWLYVPYRVKKLTLFHSTLATLEYKFSFPLEPARTYIMELKSKEIFDNVIDDNTKTGKLDIEVYPPTASVVLNNIPVKLNKDGKEQVDLFYGRYTYKITEENHYPFEGRIKINSQKTETLKIKLKQAYGWLHLANNEGIKDAVVYVDEMQIDSTTNKARIPVKHGKHSLKIENPLYHTYTAEFSIEDSTVTNMQVNLQPNYGTVTLIANDPLSSIYVDNIAKGKGSWTGKVSVGNHIFECRRGAHIPSSRTINIGNGTNITVPLDAPTPIYGTIDINTTPEGATVYINDTLAGTTPLRRNDIIIGEKQIRIEKEFYTTENRNVKISSDSTTSLSVVMTNIVPVKITSNIDSTNLYLNGKHIGYTPFADTLNGGKYDLYLNAGKIYRAINDKIEITPTNNAFHYKLKKNYTRDYELYLDINAMAGSDSYGHNYSPGKYLIPSLNLGAFINKINLELGFEYAYYNYSRDFKLAVSNSSDIYTFVFFFNRGLSAQTGYSIALSNRLRITPQVGVKLNSVKMDGYDGHLQYNNFYAYKISGTASCRISFAFHPFMGLSVTPSYRIPIETSTSYKFYEEAMGLAKKGVSLKAGIVIFIKM